MILEGMVRASGEAGRPQAKALTRVCVRSAGGRPREGRGGKGEEGWRTEVMGSLAAVWRALAEDWGPERVWGSLCSFNWS